MKPSDEIVVIDRTNKSIDFRPNETDAYELANDLVGHNKNHVIVCKIIMEVNRP